jgi:hypothetical protein
MDKELKKEKKAIDKTMSKVIANDKKVDKKMEMHHKKKKK